MQRLLANRWSICRMSRQPWTFGQATKYSTAGCHDPPPASYPLRIATILAVSISTHLWASCVSGDSFKVETVVRMQASDQAKPTELSRSTTLFVGGVVYDFLTCSAASATGDAELPALPDEIMVVDMQARALTLLNVQQAQKASLTFDMLRDFASAVSAESRTGTHKPLVQFAAAPQFERSWEPASNQLRLTSALLTYDLDLLQPEDLRAVEFYRAFADAAARLATMTPGFPADARLELNREIAAQRRLPAAVRKTIADQVYTSEHQYFWQLTEQDRAQIGSIKMALNQSDDVGFVDYLENSRW